MVAEHFRALTTPDPKKFRRPYTPARVLSEAVRRGFDRSLTLYTQPLLSEPKDQPMPDRKTFCAFGAYAVNVIDPHATVVLPLANASDLGTIDSKAAIESKLVTVDLLKRLGAPEVSFDHAILDTLGMEMGKDEHDVAKVVTKSVRPAFLGDGIDVLTVGPVFPGQHVGGIYMVREKFFNEVRPKLDPDPSDRRWPHLAKLHTYQFMSSASRDGSRYHGFHATVLESLGSKKLLEISSSSGKTRVQVDMNNRTDCDDPEFLRQEIQDPRHPKVPEFVLDAQSGPNDQGAIFLSLPLCVQLNLTSPKEPPGGGGLPTGGFDPKPSPVFRPTSGRTFLNAGTPKIDLFAQSVFERSLTNAHAAKLVIPTDPTVLESEVKQFASGMRGNGNSLDIVADAPGGVQQIDTSIVLHIVTHAENRFTQCRLLGCVTALELEGRKRMLEIAGELGIPVFGTLRAIAFPDFDDMSFRDTQRNGDETVSIVISTDDLHPTGEFHLDRVSAQRQDDIASGVVQQRWLDWYPQVSVGPEDLDGEPPAGAPFWRMPDGLLGSHVAATDDIHTSAAGVIALQTGSGAVRCEVLACATLLRLRSKTHGWIYVNIPPNSDVRRELLALIS